MLLILALFRLLDAVDGDAEDTAQIGVALLATWAKFVRGVPGAARVSMISSSVASENLAEMSAKLGKVLIVVVSKVCLSLPEIAICYL